MEPTDAARIADVRRLLRKSARSADAGRRAIGQAIRLRRAALDLVPVGAVLRFDVGRPDFVVTFRREPTTKWTSLDGAFDDGTVGDEWIEEQWMNGNLKIEETP